MSRVERELTPPKAYLVKWDVLSGTLYLGLGAHPILQIIDTDGILTQNLGHFLGALGVFPAYKLQHDSTAPERRSNAMLLIEDAILEKLRNGPCCFDEVVTSLPNFSWGEIFVAVDCMSRDRRVFLRQLGFSTYQISLGSRHAELSTATSGIGMQSNLNGKSAGATAPMP